MLMQYIHSVFFEMSIFDIINKLIKFAFADLIFLTNCNEAEDPYNSNRSHVTWGGYILSHKTSPR